MNISLKTKQAIKTNNTLLAPGLYVIGTPIGNLEDITIRAINTLSSVDIIVCEDTRQTLKLLNKYFINNKSLISYNDYNAPKKINTILEELKKGKKIALVSDAGTPLISDPGYRLVSETKKKKIKVYSIPGPSSPIAALSVSGVSTDKFIFLGFLPKQKSLRNKILIEASKMNLTLVVFERASRVYNLLNEIKNIFTGRSFTIARELTKIHEELIDDCFDNLNADSTKNNLLKGEIIILINSLKDKKVVNKVSDRILLEKLKYNAPSKVSSLMSKTTKENRNEIYKRCLKLLSKKG